jgi:hypothetical protein
MTSESEATSSEGWIPWWLKWIGIGLFSLLLIISGSYYGLTWKWKAKFEEQIQKLKQEGHPHSYQALQEAYKKRSPNQKDYSDWKLPRSLQKSLDEIESSDAFSMKKNDPSSWHPDWLNTSPAERKKKAKHVLDVLNKHKDELAKRIEKNLKPAKRDFSKGFEVPLSDLSGRLNEAEIFSYYSKALIITGEYEEAVPVLRTLYQRGKGLRQEPSLITFTEGLEITELANTGMELLLLNHRLPEKIRNVIHTESSERIKQDFLFTLEGEAIQQSLIAQTAIQKNPADPRVAKYFPPLVPKQLFWLPAAKLVRDHRMIMSLAQKPYYKIKPEWKRVLSRDDCFLAGHPIYCLTQFNTWFSSRLIPLYKGLYEKVNNTRAKLDMLQLATQAKLRSQNKGNDLIPIQNIDESSDPYSGDPYKVKETESHVILYSLGNNLKDDGASIEQQEQNDPDVWIKIKK